jgi:esterase/lipase
MTTTHEPDSTIDAHSARGRRRLAIRLALAAALLIALLVAALGPRNTSDAEATPLPSAPVPTDLAQMPAHFARLEARYPDIVPGTEKTVHLGAVGPHRAPWAVVYLHGFSASRQETAPLSESVADALGGHLFATRLTGHGRGRDAMAEGSVAAWKADALEALEVGRRLGERVLVIGVSTGATLAVWLAQQPQAQQDVAWVLISPNFKPADPLAPIINWPRGREITRWVNGPEHHFEPRNPDHARYWTARYPVEALFPMMATVHLAQQQPLERWQAPVLMLLSPKDRVIDVAAAKAAYAQIGSPAKRLVEVADATDDMQHVIAGRILSPQSTPGVAKHIVDWVGALPPAR